jgi:dTDP-4-amino-4,6-dideoxygalactose transaminase
LSITVPFNDLTRRPAKEKRALAFAFERVLSSGRYVLGPEVDAFEERCAQRLGVQHAVGVSSGSDALVVALSALGIGAGDEVICPTISFFATAGSIARTGAKPVFADVDRRTLQLDPRDVNIKLTPRTKAVVLVDLFGLVPDVRPYRKAAPHLPIVEDAAQAFGAVGAGKQGDIACFSFFPTKHLGAIGDGGLVVTNHTDLAARSRTLRVHGARAKHMHYAIGGNFRLDTLQAALLNVELDYLDERLAQRKRLGQRYEALLSGARIEPPPAHPNHSFHQFVVRAPRRDALRAHLAKEGVATEIYYPTPLHLQPCFAHYGHMRGQHPVAEAACEESLALPIFPGMTEEEHDHVCSSVHGFERTP